jgi:hypothetical protein
VKIKRYIMIVFFKRKRKSVSVFRFIAFKKIFDTIKLKEFRKGFKAYIHELAYPLHELKL